MTVLPELAARPRTEIASEVPHQRPGPVRLPPPARHRAAFPWIRLAVLLIAAVLTQVIYVFIWPLSYFMTQAPDFTYEYLVQYPAAWQRLLVLLARFDALWPGASGSLDFLVDALMQSFIGAFVLYLVVVLMVRGGLPPIV